MYHQFFGLTESAFAIAVNPRYLYMSEQHREALAHLLFGLQGGGFVQLTGEVGTGKTTIIRCLLEQLPENTDIALVLNPMASVPELLSTICDELGAKYIADRPTVKTLTDALYNQLLDNHMQGRKTVLLIDEAQSLSAEALEQIRLLTNLETHTEKLLNIILVGQPELCDLLAQPSLRQLAQRITARFHLRPLTQEETAAYIRHRLHVAGLAEDRQLIPEKIEREVHRFSGGIPRLINILCERMLLGAYGQNRTEIDQSLFEQARREITGERAEPASSAPVQPLPPAAQPITASPRPSASRGTVQSVPRLWWQLGGGIALLTGGLALGWLFGGAPTTVSPQTAAPEVVAAPVPVEAPVETPAVPEPKAPTLLDHNWPLRLPEAQRQLATVVGLQIPNSGSPCIEDDEAGHHCAQTRLDTWNDLIALDRPVVMTLITPERKLAYVPLLGLGDTRALTWADGEEQFIQWSELASMWNGEVHYFWFRPAEFDGSLAPSERNAAVRWLAERFAELDGESTPLTSDRYNAALRKRVELFQRQYDLTADGLFGENTLLQLSRALGLDPGLKPVPEER
ncbi:ExeA family protein [Marinimicrobium agarilyticum]|uniref:ExeA family protein n=1 Tax=Marinimicrobium agarilyticum TaxID=306546 RepID=UPI0004229AEE|nr:ExeA family protein [Marinimicrobium agarilyticum]